MTRKKIEMMLGLSEIMRKYPIGSSFGGGTVVDYFAAAPAAYMASFPGVIVEVPDAL